MSPKELLYIEDTLGHAQFMQQKCKETVSSLQDTELKNCVEQLAAKNAELFSRFYRLV
jgi:hypothetical protein